jgi:hypothetical protein
MEYSELVLFAHPSEVRNLLQCIALPSQKVATPIHTAETSHHHSHLSPPLPRRAVGPRPTVLRASRLVYLRRAAMVLGCFHARKVPVYLGRGGMH